MAGSGSTRRRAGARPVPPPGSRAPPWRSRAATSDTALLLSVSKADAGSRRRGLRVWSVGTPVAKGELYRWLKLEWPTDEALAGWGRAIRPAPATSRSTATSTSSSSPPSAWSPASSRAFRGRPGRRSRAGATRRWTAGSMPGPPPPSAASIAGPKPTGASSNDASDGRKQAVPAAGPSAEPQPARSPRPPARRWLLDRREDWLSRATRQSWWDR